jgi:hypothetical protein
VMGGTTTSIEIHQNIYIVIGLVVVWSRARMATTSKCPKLILTPEQRHTLEQTAQSRTRPVREVQRAQILLHYASGQSITNLSRALHVSRVAVYKWIRRALAVGGRDRPPR